MKSNGNGDFILRKGTFALLMVIISLLSCIVTVVAYGATIKADVEFLKEELSNAQTNNPLIIEKLEDQMSSQETRITQNQERILSMYDDIKEIKSDVKRLITQ